MKLKNIIANGVVIYAFLLIVPCFALSGCARPEPEGTKSAGELLKELDNPDPEIRRQAARGLNYLDDRDFEAGKGEITTALVKHLSDSDLITRHWSADALMHISLADNADIVISSMLRDLEDASLEARRRAVSALGSYYRYNDDLVIKKEEVIRVLKRHLNNENEEVRYAIVIALGEIDSGRFKNTILPFLVEILNSNKEPEIYYQTEAADVCKNIGPSAKDAVPALIKLVRKEELEYKFIYAAALKSIGTPEALAAAGEAEHAKKMWHLRGVILNCAIILSYILFFGWSVTLRKKGKKVFHWFLLIPIAMYSLVLKYALEGDSSAVDTVLSIKFFLAFAAIGCIPWLISWFILRRRESPGGSG